MWMFGSRTTVKKVRNSLTWFSHSCSCRILCSVLDLSGPPNTVSTLLILWLPGSSIIPICCSLSSLVHRSLLLQPNTSRVSSLGPVWSLSSVPEQLNKKMLLIGPKEILRSGRKFYCPWCIFLIYQLHLQALLPLRPPPPRSYHGTLPHSYSRPACAFDYFQYRPGRKHTATYEAPFRGSHSISRTRWGIQAPRKR